MSSSSLNISLLLQEKAQAHLIAFDTKFNNARAQSGQTKPRAAALTDAMR